MWYNMIGWRVLTRLGPSLESIFTSEPRKRLGLTLAQGVSTSGQGSARGLRAPRAEAGEHLYLRTSEEIRAYLGPRCLYFGPRLGPRRESTTGRGWRASIPPASEEIRPYLGPRCLYFGPRLDPRLESTTGRGWRASIPPNLGRDSGLPWPEVSLLQAKARPEP